MPAALSIQRETNSSHHIIATSYEVAELVDRLVNLPVSPPSLYIDLEGVNLSRHGSISILQIYVRYLNETYLIDIYTLQEVAFSQKGTNGNTMRDILESSTIPKVFFDVRNDADALYHHFGVTLAGVQDLQLMELAAHDHRRPIVNGLKRCLEKDIRMSFAERRTCQEVKERGRRLFAPEIGGSYEVFNIRPLNKDIQRYCAQDVRYLPRLWDVYNKGLTQEWSERAAVEAKSRIRCSQSPSFNGKGRHMALAPPSWRR
ncbi:ribonuclease H-like protein [Aspergillus sclerotioniger CBS 115572]|uniref:Ribonuclease H-like protein n=1 Tax=Aspergillus sclerotioniger CBS 115572 TaxID=1450535 RepID=A0A317XFD8_9EURO|nr:ribonuclease H-like protein [Aspergillus sclerotioniger CBS 115572]PWY96532.1 ribonuclease H-like protein [Aspergillus sclerotioniger CBS 115572]